MSKKKKELTSRSKFDSGNLGSELLKLLGPKLTRRVNGAAGLASIVRPCLKKYITRSTLSNTSGKKE